jgi:DNA mismatch endonuclease Vsr
MTTNVVRRVAPRPFISNHRPLPERLGLAPLLSQGPSKVCLSTTTQPRPGRFNSFGFWSGLAASDREATSRALTRIVMYRLVVASRSGTVLPWAPRRRGHHLRLDVATCKQTGREIRSPRSPCAGCFMHGGCASLRRRADIVFTRKHIAVFIDGCFWHGCPEHGTRQFRTNTTYWDEKIARNIRRDIDTADQLEREGWTVLRYWEHVRPDEVVASIEAEVRRQART